MKRSLLYRLFLAACLWQCVSCVDLKRDSKLSHDQQASFKYCLRTFCIESAVDLFKISSLQSCYKECLLRIGNQNLAGTQHIKPFLKRIKREFSNVRVNSTQAVDLRGHEECMKASLNATFISPDNISVTFQKFGDTGRLYANVSWNPPPRDSEFVSLLSCGLSSIYPKLFTGIRVQCDENDKTANWTGYKMIYIMGDYSSPFNCRDLGKNVSFSIVDNSSNGLLQGKDYDLFVMQPVLSGHLTIPHSLHVTSLKCQPSPPPNPHWARKRDVQIPSVIMPSVSDTLTSLPFLSGDSRYGNFKSYEIKLSQPKTETPATTTSSTDGVKQHDTSPFPGRENIGIKVALPIAAAIIVVLIGVAVLVWFYWRRSNYTEVVCHPDYEFDAFIIYSTADNTWVTGELVPTLEKYHIKYCIHYRDFTPGVAFTTNMSNSVYKSWKVVAVVSNNFLQSSFCSEEMEMALYRLAKQKDDSVIVIKLDDLSSGELPGELRHRSYIDFTKSTDRETWEEKLVKVFNKKGCSSGLQQQL